jgi:hypothetical protein
MKQDHAQLGFESLLTAAAETNRQREEERATAHLPGTMEEGVPLFRVLIRQHHAAMLAADVETTMALREEADLLAQAAPCRQWPARTTPLRGPCCP